MHHVSEQDVLIETWTSSLKCRITGNLRNQTKPKPKKTHTHKNKLKMECSFRMVVDYFTVFKNTPLFTCKMKTLLFSFTSWTGTSHHRLIVEPLWLVGLAQLITVCNLGAICPSGSCLVMREGAARASLHWYLFLPWKLSYCNSSEHLSEPRLPTASNFSTVPSEKWSGSYNSASWERKRRWSWELGAGQQAGSEWEHFPSLAFLLSGCFLSG